MRRNITPIFLFIVLTILLPIVSAEKNIDEVVQDLDIEIDGTPILRSGNEIVIRPVVINNNVNESIIIKKISFFTKNKRKVKDLDFDKTVKAIKKELIEVREIYKEQHTSHRPELTPRYKELIPIIQDGIFAEEFVLNIKDFDSSLETGDVVKIPLEIKIKYGNKNFVIKREHSILIAELLPSPSHNSPGWYKGDQHMHTNYSFTAGWEGHESIPTLSGMITEAKAKSLDWVILTDHSDSDVMNSGTWSTANTECNNEDTGSFECIYGQELAITAPGWLFCDRRHYLAYDTTPSYIEAGEGCWVEDAKDIISELDSNGGYGFVAHPHSSQGYTWFDVTIAWEDWSTTGFTGLEIINWGFHGDDATTINNPGGDDDSWREFLVDETNPDDGFIVGTAGSDAHAINAVGYGSFIYCYLDSLSQTNVVNAIKDGNCVASTGPFVEFTLDGNIIGSVVDVPDGTNTISVSANSNGFGNLQWLYIYVDDTLEEIVSLSGTSYSNSIDVNLDTSDDYIRLVIFTDEENNAGYTHRAYTNPIWVNVTSCSCGSWTEGSCGGGSCNSEQKQWTRTCTPSACAAETKCVYDEDCEDEEPGGGSGSNCTESGYYQCYEYEYGDCDVKLAVNWYENVPNDILWGAVNDAWDPYVIGEYKIGWKGVDAEQIYYNVDDPNNDCTDAEGYCQGYCDGEEIVNTGTKTTVTAPGTAYTQRVLAYDDTQNYCCWAYFNPFYPNYENNPYIYVLNCFDDSDCSAGQYCDKSSSWSNWDCVNDKSNGQSCIRDAQCSSGYCDDDGVGLSDDDHCFAPYNTYFDGQETSYCEYSTGSGHLNCDERQVGEDLNLCSGTSYYEEECSSTCGYQDVTSVFECTDAGCSCSEALCDGLTTGDNITTCASGQTYFADNCTSTATGQDRGDNICRNSTFVAGCTADPECGGIVAGTSGCNATCSYFPDDPHKFYHKNSSGSNVAWLGNLGNIVLKGKCYSGGNCDSPGDDSFIIRNSSLDYVGFINSTGDLCLETGDCSDESANCDSPGDGSFIIRNSSLDYVSYIDSTGDMCLIGGLYENSNP